MIAFAILQKGDTVTVLSREFCVDVAAFLDAAFQIRLVKVGERTARVFDGALQLVSVATFIGHGVDCAADAGAAAVGDLGTNW